MPPQRVSVLSRFRTEASVPGTGLVARGYGVSGSAGAGAWPSYPPQTDWSNWMTEPVIMPLSLEATQSTARAISGGPCLGEEPRNGRAHTLGAAGDDGHLSVDAVQCTTS